MHTYSVTLRLVWATVLWPKCRPLTKCLKVWWSGVVVSTLALINEVNLRRTRLVLRWVTVSGSIPGAGHLFQYVTNQPPKANSALHPSGVGKWVPASAGKAKAGMVHSVSGWTWGVQVKLWDPLRTRAIPERLRSAFTTRHYTNPRLPLPLKMLSVFLQNRLLDSMNISMLQHFCHIFTALHGMQTRSSDEKDVCPSVSMSVKRVDCDL